jgi:hypothetical protein
VLVLDRDAGRQVLQHVLEKAQFCVACAVIVSFARVDPQLRVGTSLHGGGL